MEDIKEIPDLPELPSEIKDAIDDNNKSLAIFIGAGVSRLIGCDGWNTLAKNLVKKCAKKNYILPITKESLLKQSDQVKLISMCHNIFCKKNDENSFMTTMKESLKDKEVDTPAQSNDKFKIYKDLKNIGNTFITTNVDRFIDRLFDGVNITFELVDLKQNNISNSSLYKIHGCVSKIDSLVFTKNKYMSTYTDQGFIGFIEQFFSTYTVLFVGYGLSEFELLSKILPIHDTKPPRHLFLNPYYKYEKELCNLEFEYFSGLGIKLIPFARDKEDYNQLIKVIGAWKEEIDKHTYKIQNSFNDIIKVLENPL